MAWAEVSLAMTPEHETLIDALYDIFFHSDLASSSTSEEKKEEEYVPRSRPWVPHLSMCYDNPEGLGTSLCRSSMVEFMKEKYPALLENDNNSGGVRFTRAVTGISLWRTAGKISDWDATSSRPPRRRLFRHALLPPPAVRARDHSRVYRLHHRPRRRRRSPRQSVCERSSQQCKS